MDWAVEEVVWAPASLLFLHGLASTSRNSNTSTSVLGMEERLAEDEVSDPVLISSSGIRRMLLEGEDFGHGGRGPNGASFSSSLNRFSILPEPSFILDRRFVDCFET